MPSGMVRTDAKLLGPAARLADVARPAGGRGVQQRLDAERRLPDTALGAFYRRLSSRIGKAKAVTGVPLWSAQR